jgi:hypothetical protein
MAATTGRGTRGGGGGEGSAYNTHDTRHTVVRGVTGLQAVAGVQRRRDADSVARGEAHDATEQGAAVHHRAVTEHRRLVTR